MSSEDGAAVSWRWRDRDAEHARRLVRVRRGGIVRGVFALIVAAILFALDRWLLAALPAVIGAVTLTLAIASPLGAYLGLERAVNGLGALVGRVLAYVLLAPVYVCFFMPYGFLFRRGARDPLHRRFDRDRKSYWSARPKTRPMDRPY